MINARLQTISTNDQIHSKESILSKLDSDLTDSERKSYLKILLESPETSNLLTIAALEWKNKLFEQQIKIETLKELIRVKDFDIVTKEKYKDFYTDEEFVSMKKSIEKDISALNNIQTLYETSSSYARKSQYILEPSLEESIEIARNSPKI